MLKSLNAQNDLRKRVITPGGEGMIISYDNNRKIARAKLDDVRDSKTYSYDEIKYADLGNDSSSDNSPNK